MSLQSKFVAYITFCIKSCGKSHPFSSRQFEKSSSHEKASLEGIRMRLKKILVSDIPQQRINYAAPVIFHQLLKLWVYVRKILWQNSLPSLVFAMNNLLG